jgi:glycosyltransferase involved in cell wall biosynthesis
MSVPGRVLIVCHNHPSFHAGGTEIFSYDLFRELKSRGVEALFLACTNRVHRARLPGTLMQAVGRAPDELVLWAGHFDRFMLSQIDLHGVIPELERLLLEFRPDIVHFQHVLLVGVEAIQLVRRVLPDARIVVSLHDYYPICANDGQMVTTPRADGSRVLCARADADSCAKCFPDAGRDAFVMRELFVKQAFAGVDRFIAPSAFLKARYVAWGIDAARIEIVRNGLAAAGAAPHRVLGPSGRRDRFAFFGHLNPYKGALVAVDAARRLAAAGDGEFTLTLHGGADFQTEAFRAEIKSAIDAVPQVHATGPYERADIARLIAAADWVLVPSIWWENAPLVIQEAFQHRRPVIAADIGGMAEAVHPGIDALTFRAGDAADLAARMAEAADQALWSRLVAGIAAPRTIAQSTDDHLALYGRLMPGAKAVQAVSRAPEPARKARQRRRANVA